MIKHSKINSVSGCTRDDLRGLRLPDDVSQTLRIQRCRLQFPDWLFYHPMGDAGKWVLPHASWENPDWYNKVTKDGR